MPWMWEQLKQDKRSTENENNKIITKYYSYLLPLQRNLVDLLLRCVVFVRRTNQQSHLQYVSPQGYFLE